jgi:hypothetical protein
MISPPRGSIPAHEAEEHHLVKVTATYTDRDSTSS